MGAFPRNLDRRAALHRHYEELPDAVYEAVIRDLSAIGGERGGQRGHVTTGNLLDFATLNRHPINLLGPAAIGVEYQPTSVRRHIVALDLLASACHWLRQAATTAAMGGNRNRPYVCGPRVRRIGHPPPVRRRTQRCCVEAGADTDGIVGRPAGAGEHYLVNIPAAIAVGHVEQ